MSETIQSWRMVHLDGVGAIEVRRPTLRDICDVQPGDQAWWHRCVRRNGAAMSRDEVLDLDVEVAAALAAEVTKARPTQPPSGGSGG